MATISSAKATSPGRDVLRDPRFNHGTAFTAAERSTLGLDGLLPSAILPLEVQANRSYEQYSAQPTDLAKNEFLAALHDRNEILYYKLLEDHLKEMLPVVYDPVVAQAIEQYSHQYRRPRGVYLSIDHLDAIETDLKVLFPPVIDVNPDIRPGSEIEAQTPCRQEPEDRENDPAK